MGNLTGATYSAKDAAFLAGIDVSQLNNWLARGHLVGHRDIGGGGSRGKRRELTFQNVIEVAMADAIKQSGIGDMAMAFAAASFFSHSGGPDPLGGPDRQMGFPYHPDDGITLLAIAGMRSETYPLQIKGDENLYPLLRHKLGNPVGMQLINATAVFRAVIERMSLSDNPAIQSLRMDYDPLLNAAYGKAAE